MASLREERRSRTLVLCFDGTNDRYDDDNTNIVKLMSLLKKDDPEAQMVYYQTGIGTYTQPGILGMISAGIAKAIDVCIAWWIDAHVIEGYQFLMRNHRKGDKICIFGFSRGAYCGRALAGMLNKVGLLPKDNEELVPFAFDLYRQSDKHGVEQSSSFKKTFCKSIEIEFLGVWDTVSSVGILFGRNLPFTASNRIVKTFRHAVSLDEHRAKFTANLWHKKPKHHHHTTDAHKDDSRPPSTQSIYKTQTRGTDVLEVFFAGGHADVGGGNDVNSTLHSLSNISLRWMLREIVKAQCGILFDNSALKRMGIPQSTFYLSSAFRDFKPKSHLSHQLSSSCLCGTPRSPQELTSFLRRRSSLSAEPYSAWSAGDQGFDMGVVQDEPDEVDDSVSDGVSTAVAPDHKESSAIFDLYTKARDFVWPISLPINTDGACTFADHYRMSSHELDAEDAVLGEMHDELHRQPLWWILECLPVRRSWQQPQGVWHHSYWPNLFRARHLPAPDYQPHVHHTVLLRRQMLGYEPRIDLSKGFIIVE